MNLIQRFIGTMNVENPAKAVGDALRLRGRELIVVSLLEPELFTSPADWLAVLLSATLPVSYHGVEGGTITLGVSTSVF